MKYQFILERHVRYSVGNQCRVLEVSRSGYYQWRQQEMRLVACGRTWNF